jgi:hypothetical protein
MKAKAILLICFTTMLWGTYIAAGPLKFEPQTLKQPDGTTLLCFASGDEYYNWLHDSLGFTIIQNKITGYYVYAQRKSGDLVPTQLIAGKSDPLLAGLTPWLKHSAEIINAAYSSLAKRFMEDESGKNAPTTGTINNIVVFIRFSDEPEFTDAVSLYDGILTQLFFRNFIFCPSGVINNVSGTICSNNYLISG